MRARIKKHIDERIKYCEEIVVFNAEAMSSKWADVFSNNNPVFVELGCGKGDFIIEMAKRNPNVNYIAIEKNASVFICAIEKAFPLKLSNLKFVNSEVQYLKYMFAENEINEMFINFCDPWPSSKKAKRRLTNRAFLEIYKKILKNDGNIYLKTDNEQLFDYSLDEFYQSKFSLSDITYDLNDINKKDIIMSEYERKFSQLGMPIYSAVAKKIVG